MASLNSVLNIFTPKNRLFYDLFEKMVDRVVEMSEMLKQLVAERNYDKRAQLTNSIENLEHVCDDISHNIFTELGRNFITPFDREDIHSLASSLDDIADHIHGSSKKISFYNVNPIDDGIQKMAELIDVGSKHVKNAVYCLRNMKDLRKMTEALVRINDIENEADDIFDMSIEKLFANEPDAKEVIKKREIYQIMEIATDKCEDAANVIETIIVKYA
jgi:uncharacterized protein